MPKIFASHQKLTHFFKAIRHQKRDSVTPPKSPEGQVDQAGFPQGLKASQDDKKIDPLKVFQFGKGFYNPKLSQSNHE